MDESGFEKEVLRAFGYSPQGLPCIDKYNWQQKNKTNVIGALYLKTLFAVDSFQHNVNWKVVYNWFKETLIPKLNRKRIIVMDNASFHKARRIRKLLNRKYLNWYATLVFEIISDWTLLKLRNIFFETINHLKFPYFHILTSWASRTNQINIVCYKTRVTSNTPQLLIV